MVRKPRLNTKNHGKKRQWGMLVLVVFLLVTTAGWLKYKEQVTSLKDISRETFPFEIQTGNSFRGTIYDRNFKELARTLERVSVYVRPREVTDIPGTAAVLSELLALPESELKVQMQRDSHLVWLRRDIGQEEEVSVGELNLPGIYLDREVARSYPMQEYASHLIGYSENDLGLSGVEHYYNRLLNHDRVLQKDIPTIDLKGLEQTSANGHDLVLTLDTKIQAILEKYIAGLGEKMGGGRITSLLLDTARGEIVAGASYPAYNPNHIWKSGEEVLANLLLTPMVVPDEIRRIFRDAALLQGGWEQSMQVFPWSLVSGEASFSRQLRLWDRLQLITDLKVDFSGGEKKNEDLPEYTSCIPAMDLGTVPLTATPLKVLLGMTHLLNGGKKVQPHILHRIIGRPGQREFYYDAFHGQSGGRNVYPALLSAELRLLLKSQGRPGVLGSSSLSGEKVSLWKQRPGSPDRYYVRDRMALVMIPAEQPELILLLAARSEELEPGIFSPLLCENIDSVLPSMVSLQQISQNVSGLHEIEEKEDQNFVVSDIPEPPEGKILAEMLEQRNVLMPDLEGLSLRKSLRLLQRAGVSVTVKGTGRVVYQSPKAGKALVEGERCVLTLKVDAAPGEGL